MNDNYLWDKSGAPDEEVRHLESLLREFRYQPRPLVLPDSTPQAMPIAATKAMIFSFPAVRYAAIAALALLTLGLGLWLSVRPSNAPEMAAATPTPTVTPTVAPPSEPAPQRAPLPPAPQPIKQPQTAAPKTHFAHHTPKRATRKALEAEGERAKEKVLYALQITSEKLNLIAKKVQTDTN